MTRRTGLSWLGNLAVGLGSIGLVTFANPVSAATLAGTLDGSGAMHQQAWQTAYLMAEGSAESKVVGPLNRGARLEIDPARSSEQYWFVKVPDSPGGAWQGFVWKDFVRVSAGGPGASSAAAAPGSTPASPANSGWDPNARVPAPAPAKLAPMTASLAERDGPRKRSGKTGKTERSDKPEKLDRPEKTPVADSEKVVARPRVELEKDAARARPDNSMVAYDPELFEVSDASGVRATPGTEPVVPKSTVSPAMNPLGVPPAAPPYLVGAAPAVDAGASPVRQIQALREQIERELEAVPQTALSANAAHSVDGLVARLNEVLKIERAMLKFLETTSKTVEAHDRHINDLQQRVTTLASKGGPERAGLSDEITRLRKRLDELSATVSTTRQHAKRIDALEAKLRRGSPVALEPAGGRVDSEHGSMVVGGPPVGLHDPDLEQKAGELESRITSSRKKASALAHTVDSAPGPDEVDIPHIDARSSEKLIAKLKTQKEAKRDAERMVEEGVIEIVSKDVPADPDVDVTPVSSAAKPPPIQELEKGAGLQNGTVSAMLKKLRELREERRKERESREPEPEVAAGGTAGQSTDVPAPAARSAGERSAASKEREIESLEARTNAEPTEADLAPIGSGSPPELEPAGGEPIPDDMRTDEAGAADADAKTSTSSKSSKTKRAETARRMRLGDIENLLSARL